MKSKMEKILQERKTLQHQFFSIWVVNELRKILPTVYNLLKFFDNIHNDYRMIMTADDQALYCLKFVIFKAGS